MNKPRTHLRSSSMAPVMGTTAGMIAHGATNHEGSDWRGTHGYGLPAVPSRTRVRAATATVFDISNPIIDKAGDVGVPRTPTGTPGSWQRTNIEKETFRHKAFPSLPDHRDETEAEGPYPASQPHFTQNPALRLIIPKTSLISTSSVATPRQSSGITRSDAMHKLLSSERTYACDLALICDVHIPLAQGKPICANDIPSLSALSAHSRSGSSPALCLTPSSSSTNPSQSRPPMTSDDVGIVFRNINDIASFSSHFVERLERAFGRALDGDSDEDKVGELFLEIIPYLEPLYKTYLRTHSAALNHLQRLSLSPALWRYPSDIRNLLSSDTRIPDLPSFLLKPEQRVPEYCRLLGFIIDTTPVSHRGLAALIQARDRMERVARDINNGRKVVRGDLAISTTPTANGTNGHGNTETSKLAQLESRLQEYPSFLDRLAEHVKNWEIATRRSVESLHRWGIAFGAVLGLAPSPSTPYPPAYEVFTSLLSSLPGLCTTLENDLQNTFSPLLHKLKAMIEHPKRLLNEMHSLESSRTPSSPLARRWRPDTAKNHQRQCLYLRSALSSQLPVLLDAMDRAIGLAIRIMIQRRVAFLEAVRDKWIHFFDSLKEEEERYGGTEETLRAWQARWEVGRQMLSSWEERHRLGESAVREISPATRSEMSLPVQLSVTPARLRPVKDIPSFPLGAPRKLRMSVSYPPEPPSPRRTRQSVIAVASVLYTIRAIRSYSPPRHNPYRGHSFFKLVNGDSFEVLQEYDHPSTHTDLPQFFLDNKGEDCLLKVRARSRGVGYEAGDVGWALARFVCPAD